MTKLGDGLDWLTYTERSLRIRIIIQIIKTTQTTDRHGEYSNIAADKAAERKGKRPFKEYLLMNSSS